MAAWTEERARRVLRQVFDAAVARAAPGPAILRHLPEPPAGRCVVVGAGKASAAMAAAVDAAWRDVDLSGVVVTRYGHAVPAGRIEILEARHPTPDAAGEAASRRILAAVAGLGPDDLVLALMSGGGSALLCLPAAGMTLADKEDLNRQLLGSGASIGEMNAVRKHLSGIKGGRLALAARPARLVTLAISDVPGDDPGTIASGPTLPDASTLAEARAVVARYGLALTPATRRALEDAAETPKPADLPGCEARIVASPLRSLEAAAEIARANGATPLILGDALEGEARVLGTVMAGIARSAARHGHPGPPPLMILSGGETTVSFAGAPHGRGGRNTEFLLGLSLALGGHDGIWAVAGDSDGIDGTEDAAGAFAGPGTLGRVRQLGLDPAGLLAAHESYVLFDALGDLIRTGPTLTNVNDIRAVLVA